MQNLSENTLKYFIRRIKSHVLHIYEFAYLIQTLLYMLIFFYNQVELEHTYTHICASVLLRCVLILY